MTKTKKGFKKDWTDYYGRPATTYYRNKDILSACTFHGYKNIEDLLSRYDWKWWISNAVEPYRVIYY